MPERDDDVLNVLNTNTQNNIFNSGASQDDELQVLNDNTQSDFSNTNPKSNSFGITLDDSSSEARNTGYLEKEAGFSHASYDDLKYFGGEDALINRAANLKASTNESVEPEPETDTYEDPDLSESPEKIYEDILGVTQYSDLKKACGLNEKDSYTDFYNRTHYIPKGYEVTAKLLLAEEKVKKVYAEYKAGNIGYSDFLYKAYGKDILKSQGIDLESKLYWYNKAQKNDYTNPLDSNSFLADVLSLADQKFQSESWYEFASLDNLKNNIAVIASGEEVTADNIKTLFKSQMSVINEYFESEEKFLKLYKAGYVDLNTFNPFIDIDNDGVYDYYFATDGKLYAAENSSGTGNKKCKIYYETNDQGEKVVDRVSLGGAFGNGEFGEVVDSFFSSLFSVFTGLIDFGAQFIGLIGKACGNDDIILDWNAFKNNNLLFGGSNVKDFGGFNVNEMDDWARAISSGIGTITGMIASVGVTTGLTNLAGKTSTQAASLAAEAAKEGATVGTKAAALGANALNKGIEALSFANRTYSGLRGGSLTTMIPQLAEHAITNRAVTAVALAFRDGISTANKLLMQNEMLPDEKKLTGADITSRFFINLFANSVTSFALRAVGDSGVTDFFNGELSFTKGIQKGISDITSKVGTETIQGLANAVGTETINTLGATLLGRGINTVGDIIENILTQTTTAFLSNPELNAESYFKTMGNLISNPSFILTNLYIAKQDMGLKLLGRDDNNKLTFMPRIEDNFIKAGLSAGKSMVDTLDNAMNKLQAKYVELIKQNKPDAADALYKGIIEPAINMRSGEKGESTLSATFKTLTWLCNQTVDIPLDSLGLTKDEIKMLSPKEKESGPIRALILADLKKGVTEKIIAKAAYRIAYYQKAAKQIYDTNINTFKGEFSLRQAFEDARINFENNSVKVDYDFYQTKKGKQIDVTNKAYVIEKDYVASNDRLKEIIQKHASAAYNQSNFREKNIFLTQEEYDNIAKDLKDNQVEGNEKFERLLNQKTDNVVRMPGQGKSATLLDQLNFIFGLSGCKTKYDESIFNSLQFMREARKGDFDNITDGQFEENFNNCVEIDHIENDNAGNLSKEYQALADNESFNKAAKDNNFSNGKDLLVSSNIIRIKGEAVNAIRSGGPYAKIYGGLKALSKMGFVTSINYNEGGASKELFIIPRTDTIFGSLMKADQLRSSLQSIYVLAVSTDKAKVKSAANILINTLLDANARIVGGKDAKEFVKDYSAFEVETEEDDNGDLVAKNKHDYNIDFLNNPKYKDQSKELLATALAVLAIENNNAIDRTQLIRLFDALDLSFDNIDSTSNNIDIKKIKDYLEVYDNVEIVSDAAQKIQNNSNGVSQTDLNTFAAARDIVLRDKDIQKMLMDDKLIGNNFFRDLEKLNSFTVGQSGEVRKNLPFESLVTVAKNYSQVEEYLSEDDTKSLIENIIKEANTITKINDNKLDSELLESALAIKELYANAVNFNKKNLIILNLARLETKELHSLIRQVETESVQEALANGSEKAIRGLEKKLANRKILDSIRQLSALQKNNSNGVLTFDKNNSNDVEKFKSIMIALGYSDKELNGMLNAGISRINGVSFTSAYSKGIEFLMSKKEYDELMNKASAIYNKEITVLDSKKKPISISLSIKDRYASVLSNDEIKALTLDELFDKFNIKQTNEGGLELSGLLNKIATALKKGKSASKQDKVINRIYENSYDALFKSKELKELGDALTLASIIESVKNFEGDEGVETNIYAFNIPTFQKNKILNNKIKSLYKIATEDIDDNTTKVIVGGINKENWNLKYILDNFSKNGNVDLTKVFLLPYDKFNDYKKELFELTYNSDEIDVEGLNANGANLLTFIKEQNFERFDTLESFYNFITSTKINIGKYKDETEIKNDVADIIKKELIKQNTNTIKELTSLGFTDKEFDIIYDKDRMDKIARAVENNMGEYTHLGVDKDGEYIVNKLDYEMIAKESGESKNSIQTILSLLKTPFGTFEDDDPIFLINKPSAYTDLASIIRYNQEEGTAFISVDDILTMSKEQYDELKKIVSFIPEVEDALAIIGKYNKDEKRFVSKTEDNVNYSAERDLIETGKETTHILSNGLGFIDNEDTRKLAASLIERTERNMLERNANTFYKKASAMNLDSEASKWLAELLNVYTMNKIDNSGSALVANMENKLAVGEMLNSIGSLAYILQDSLLSDGTTINLDQDVAIRLALKIYFNTTGTDMSSSYNRYTLVYKDESDNWHIESVGDNLNGNMEYLSLGRQLFKNGILNGATKYKEAYLFDATKNVMSSNASAYGENIKVMNLTQDNLDELSTQIFVNAAAVAQQRGYLNISDLDDNNKLNDAVSRVLGSALTRTEMKDLFTSYAKTRIVESVSKSLESLDEDIRNNLLTAINSQVDSLVKSTLDTVQNIQSSSPLLDLKSHAVAEINRQRGNITEEKYNELMEKANQMVNDTYDAFTFFINKSSLPKDVAENINLMKELALDELKELSFKGFDLVSDAKGILSKDSSIVANNIKRYLETVNDEHKVIVVSKIVKAALLSGNRGKNIQYALLCDENYLKKLQEISKNDFTKNVEDVMINNKPIKELVGEDKNIIVFDLENYFKDNSDESLIYEIAFAKYTGTKDFTQSSPEKYRILFKYDDLNYNNETHTIDGWNTLASAQGASDETISGYNNYIDSLKYTTKLGSKVNGEYIYVVHVNSKTSNEEVLKYINEVVNKMSKGQSFTLVGHNSKSTDLVKIKNQFGSAGLLEGENVDHIDTFEDIAKNNSISSDASINEASASLENIARQMGEEYKAHTPIEDAMLTYKYLLFKINNQIDTDSIRSDLIKDIDKILSLIDQSNIDKNELFKNLNNVVLTDDDGNKNTLSFKSFWDRNESLKEFKDVYSKFGMNASTELINDLVKQRNIVLASDEAHYIRKLTNEIYTDLTYENQRNFIDWLDRFDEEGKSNLVSFREKLSLFIPQQSENELTKDKFNDAVNVINNILLFERNNNKKLTMEDFFKLPTKEIKNIIENYNQTHNNEISYDHIDAKRLTKFLDKQATSQEFEESKIATEKLFAADTINKIYRSIDSLINTKNLNSQSKQLLYDVMSALKTGSFDNAFAGNSSDTFRYKYNGPLYKKNFWFKSIEDAIDTFADSATIDRKWTMASGVLPGQEVELYNGEKIKFKSTDIGLTKKYFEALVGGSIEDYRESIGVGSTDDLYIQIYRNPGVEQNVIHTYRVRILDNSYNNIILTPDIFAAYHGGDFDSDKVIVIKPDKQVQRYGEQYLLATDKVWAAADPLITLLYNDKYKTETAEEKVQEFENQYGKILDILDYARSSNELSAKQKEALDEAVKLDLIKKVDVSKYPSLKPSEKINELYYTDYVKDVTSDEIKRRLALDTKFFINQIIAPKDSATGFASKYYKYIMPGRAASSSDASDLFTYNHFGLSKISLARLQKAIDVEGNKIFGNVIKSINIAFGKDVASTVSQYFKDIISNNSSSTLDKANSIVNAFRIAELLYRQSDEFYSRFTHGVDSEGKETALIPNLIAESDLSDEQEKVAQLIEYAKLNGIDPGYSVEKNKTIDSSDVRNLSYKDLINLKWNITNNLKNVFNMRKFIGTSGSKNLSNRIVNRIKAQITTETDASKVRMIDGAEGKNYITASALVAMGPIKSLAADTLIYVGDNIRVANVDKISIADNSLSKANKELISKAEDGYWHSNIELTDNIVIKHGQRIVSVVDANGKSYSSLLDENGNVRNNIKFINVAEVHSALNNKFAMVGTGSMKGTIVKQVKFSRNSYDIDKDIEALKQFSTEYESFYEELEKLSELEIDKETKTYIIETRKKIAKARKEQAELTEKYANERAEFDKKQLAKGEGTWDQLYIEFEFADKKRKQEIINLHNSIKKKYADKIDKQVEIIKHESEQLYDVLSRKGFTSDFDELKPKVANKESKAYQEVLNKKLKDKLNSFYSRLQELKQYYDLKHTLKAEKQKLKNDLYTDERIRLLDKFGVLGIDPTIYGDIENLDIEDVRRINKALSSVTFISADNLLDLSKNSANMPDYDVSYYDKNMNKLDNANGAVYKKITGRFFCAEANSFWNDDLKTESLDRITFVNDRTNPDSLYKFNNVWYSMDEDGNIHYDSEKQNQINKIISQSNTPWASSTNGTRIYRTLLAKVMYEHCKTAQEQININDLIQNMLQGNSTSGNVGRYIISKLFDMMSDEEVKKLYTSSNAYVKFLLNKLDDFMPALNEVDAKELSGKKKLESKNTSKEISKNNTTLYYFTKGEGEILDDQVILNGNKLNENDEYNYIDNSDTFYSLEDLVSELAEVSNVDSKVINRFKNNISKYTLMNILNFANGVNGTMANQFNTQSFLDSIAYRRHKPAIAGPADPKVGDVAAAIKGITPDQKVLSPYSLLGKNLSYLLKLNSANNLLDDSERNDNFIRGNFYKNYSTSKETDLKDKRYWQTKYANDLIAYGSTQKNRLAKARALTTNEDTIISDIAPRYFGFDKNKGLIYTANPEVYRGTYGGFNERAYAELSGYAQHDLRQNISDSINKTISDDESFKNNYLKAEGENLIKYADSIKELKSLSEKINKPTLGDIQRMSMSDVDMDYIHGTKAGESSPINVESEYDRIINSFKTSKSISTFDIDRLNSSNIKQVGMDRTIVAYNANVKTYRNQLLGKEYLLLNNYLSKNETLRNGYNEYVKLKNLMTSLNYVEEKLNTVKRESTVKFYTEQRESILSELGVTNYNKDIQTIKSNINRYANVYRSLDSLMDTLTERIYNSQKAFCNATGQTCAIRELYFLPKGINRSYSNDSKKTSSLLFAGTAKYTTNPFSITKNSTNLNPKYAYTEFDALANITSVATEVGKLQAILTYRDEAKMNGAMSNILSYDETCKIVGSKLDVESLNKIKTNNYEEDYKKGYNIFLQSAQDQLKCDLSYSFDGKTAIAKYADLYNQIYNKLISPLKDTYGDISFNKLLSYSMSNPQDQVVETALKAYSIMMDAVGKISSIQIQNGSKSTIADDIYSAITKLAEEKGYVIVDQFGREYTKDLSQFKALTKSSTDDYIFRATHGDLVTEGSYEQNVAIDALRGDLYFMDPVVAKQTQSMFYTREQSDIKKFSNIVKNVATKLIMANPAKFVSRMINFSMFDLNSSIATGNFEMIKYLPQMTKDISGYLQSGGEYCPESLREFMSTTGIDPLKEQIFYGENVSKSKNPYFDFVTKQFTAQHLANRYALYLSIKNTIDANGGDVSSIYSRLGNSYYLKDQIQDIVDNTKTNIEGIEQSPSSRVAALIVSNAYGTYGDMPGLASSLSKHGFMFTTFPMALVRFARNEIRSGATAIKEIFTGTANTSTLKYLGRQVGSLLSLVAIQAALQILPAVLIAGDDEEERKKLVTDVIENDTSIDMFQSILLNDTVFNSSTLWNPFYGVKSIFANPLINSIKEHKDDTTSKVWNTFGDALATYFNQNVWGRLNPMYTLIPDAVIPNNKWTNPYSKQGTDFFDNLSRKALSYSLGTNGANAFMNTIESSKYDDTNFVSALVNGYNNSLKEELGNSKSYKSSWKNYNNALTIIYNYKKASNKNSYDTSIKNFNQDYYSGLKAKLKNAMRVKSSPTTIYNIIQESLNSNVSKEEIKSAIQSVSLRVQIQKLSNQSDFLNSLSQKDYNSVKSALAYEDSIFPNLDDLYDETIRDQIRYKVNNSTPTFKKTNYSLKTYGYNYPTYTSSKYKHSNKNYYYNNLNNWNTNTNFNKNKTNKSNPFDVYNKMRQVQSSGTSTDVWGNETRHYTDGTTYSVKQLGMPFPGGNK